MAIGRCLVPGPLWDQMQVAILFDLQVPEDRRVGNLVQEYGRLDKEFLVSCTLRISKRLGTERAKHAIAAIRRDDMAEFIRQVLVYYDKLYRKGLDNRPGRCIFRVRLKNGNN